MAAACIVAAAVLIIVFANRTAIFQSENASLSLHVLGVGESAALARAQYEESWKFAGHFLDRNRLYEKKIRMTGIASRRVQDRLTHAMSYVVERRIDIYGKNWDELLRYHNLAGLSQPSRAFVVADLPRMIPTYGDLLIVVTVLLAAMCAGPLQLTRYDDYPSGMHPVAIFMHVIFIAFAFIAIWDALDQPHRSPVLIGAIAVGTVLLLGRWLVPLRAQWAAVLGLARVPP